MKKAVLYARTSTIEQNITNQLLDLRKLAAQRGFEVVREYCDKGISGSKAKRPGLDAMMADARRGEFSVLLIAALDRLCRSTKHCLQISEELNSLGIELISAREAIDSSTPQGKMFITMISSFAELERNIIVERIRAGMRRAKMEGQRLGRAPLDIDRDALVRDRLSGLSLTQVAKRHRVSRATVVRLVREASQRQIAVAA